MTANTTTTNSTDIFFDKDELFDILDQTSSDLVQSLLDCQKEAQQCFSERLDNFYNTDWGKMTKQNPLLFGWFYDHMPYTHLFLDVVASSFAPFFVKNIADAKTIQKHVALFTKNKDFVRHFLCAAENFANDGLVSEAFEKLNNHPYVSMDEKERQKLGDKERSHVASDIRGFKNHIWQTVTSTTFSEEDVKGIAGIAIDGLKKTLDHVLTNRRLIIQAELDGGKTAPSNDHVAIFDGGRGAPTISRDTLKEAREHDSNTRASPSQKGPQ